VRGEGPWLVVVTGPSKVGKSRGLFEALRRVSGGRWRPLQVIAPVNTEAVRALLASGRSSRRDKAPPPCASGSPVRLRRFRRLIPPDHAPVAAVGVRIRMVKRARLRPRYRGPMSSQRVPGGAVHKLPADLRKALIANTTALDAWNDIPQRVHLLGRGRQAGDDPRAPHSPDPGGAGARPAPALLLAGVQAPRAHRQVAAGAGPPTTCPGTTRGGSWCVRHCLAPNVRLTCWRW
jgi:hypothetical protein